MGAASSESGDMGFVLGEVFTEKPVRQKSSYLRIWRKNSNGKLAIVLDLENPVAPYRDNNVNLRVRRRVPVEKGNNLTAVKEAFVFNSWDLSRTALLICDVWDNHWCPTATARVNEMVPRMNKVVEEARQKGAFIIHAPSECMKFYEGTPQ